MGMDLGSIWASVGLDTAKLQKGLNDAQLKFAKADASINAFNQRLNTVSTQSQQTGTAMQGMGKIIAAIGLGGGALILAKKGFDLLVESIKSAIDFTKQTIEEAGKQEDEYVRLNAILKATGEYTDENSRILIENAKALQNKTIFTDEDVMASEAQLAVYKLTTDQMIGATQVIADMATAMGTDLGSATTIVGKAMEGITTPLRRYGIILDDTRIKTEGASYVLSALQDRFKGIAAEAANTASGLKTKIGNQLGELKETIGTAFLPTLEKLENEFLNGIPIMDSFGKTIGNTKSPLSDLQDFAGNIAIKIKEFLDTVMKADYDSIIKGFKDLSDSVRSLIGSTGFTGLTSSYQGFVNAAGKSLEVIGRVISSFGTMIELCRLSLKTFQLFNTDWFGPSGKAAAAEWEKTWNQIGIDLDKTINGFKNNADMVELFGKNIDSTIPKFITAADAFNKYTNETKNAGQESETAAEKVDRLRSSFNQLIDDIFGGITTYNDFQEAGWAVEAAEKALAQAIKEHGIKSQEAMQAQNNLDDAMIVDIETAFKLSNQIGTTTEQQEEARQKAVELGLEYVKSGGIGEQAFVDMAKQFGLSADDIIKYAGGMNTKLAWLLRARTLELNLQDNATGAVIGVMNNINKLIADYHPTIGIGTHVSGTAYAMGGIIPHAAGGMVVPQLGNEIPIMAHAGEMILNDSQQGNLINALWGVANGKIGTSKGDIILNFYEPMNIREEADIHKLAKELADEIKIKKIGMGIR